MRSEPPMRYNGLSCGRHHRLGHKAHSEAHQGDPGPGHSGAMTSMWQPSRDAFATNSSMRLKVGLAHRNSALA